MTHIKIAHECMNSLFFRVQRHTDYDYALVHLLEENEDYRKLIEHAAVVRELYLDNSIFELGTAFKAWFTYYKWIRKLKPTYTVLPDVLDDGVETLKNIDDWFEKYPDTLAHTKTIAVAQGKTTKELKMCFDALQNDERIFKVGVSFDSAAYLKGRPPSGLVYARGRATFLNSVTNRGKQTSVKKPIHLLGCSLPQEMTNYHEYEPGVIESVDTSCPVVHGYFNIPITGKGLKEKTKKKLADMISVIPSRDQEELIIANIKAFKELVVG